MENAERQIPIVNPDQYQARNSTHIQKPARCHSDREKHQYMRETQFLAPEPEVQPGDQSYQYDAFKSGALRFNRDGKSADTQQMLRQIQIWMLPEEPQH